MMEFEQWLYEFKRLYRGTSGDVTLPYRTLRYLLERWNEGDDPKTAVEKARLIVASEARGNASHP